MASRSITVKLKGANDEYFREVQKRLCLYERFVIANDNNALILFSKYDNKSVYSIDAGGVTSELNAALLAIHYYLGDYQKHVEICVH